MTVLGKGGAGGEDLSSTKQNKGVCHTVALPFLHFKSILRQKKNDGNSNISPCKNILIFQKKKNLQKNINLRKKKSSKKILIFKKIL